MCGCWAQEQKSTRGKALPRLDIEHEEDDDDDEEDEETQNSPKREAQIVPKRTFWALENDFALIRAYIHVQVPPSLPSV